MSPSHELVVVVRSKTWANTDVNLFIEGGGGELGPFGGGKDMNHGGNDRW